MKKIVTRTAAVAVMATLTTTAAMAQDKVEASVGADIVSSYIWRGQDLGNAAVQPALSLSYKGFSLGAWGSVGIVDSNDDKEFDLSLSYSTGGFTIGVTDYWFAYKDIENEGIENKYFHYDSHNTSHVFEVNVGYDFGVLAANWYTNFGGNDGVNKSGDRAYSSYFELSAPFSLGGLNWDAAVGMVPWATDFYGDASGFAVTNVSVKATRDIKITDSFSLPIFGQAIWNPSNEGAYFVVGVSL